MVWSRKKIIDYGRSGIRPGILVVSAQVAHRVPTGARVLLAAGGQRVEQRVQHLPVVRPAVDFCTPHNGRVLERALPPFQAALRALGREVGVTASLPTVVSAARFKEVRRRRFLLLAFFQRDY